MRFLGGLVIAMLGTIQVMACTGILLQSENETSVNGRTVEFGRPLNMSVAVIPRGFSFVGKIPKGEGMKYQSKYAAVGGYCFDEPVLMDGINEKGLVAAAFYFPGYASYGEVTRKNRDQALSPVDFTNWILTQFATIDEVKKALDNVVIAPTVLKDWGDTPPPFHYIVYDASGKSIVIEPLEHTLKIYDNPLGTITNSPTFDWMMTNLNNYINLTPYNIEGKTLRGVDLSAFGQGSGMLGLPGDFTPPSRFIRAALFSTAAVMPKNSEAAVDAAFHILNQFDIPVGAVREKNGKKTAYDFTMITSVKDPQALKYFYRSYSNQGIEFVDLNQVDLDAKEIKAKKMGGEQRKVDVSSMLE